MEQIKSVTARVAARKKASAHLVPKVSDPPVQFHVRDITNRRTIGEFESERLALDSLKGRADGLFSINNHQGDWCEVEIRGGDRFVRHALMIAGAPAAFTNIELGK